MTAAAAAARRPARRIPLRWLVPTLYIVFLMLPIYWLINMSFKTTNEILGGFSPYPQNFTVDSYVEILTNPTWYWGYINSIIYVAINTVLSVSVALPAARPRSADVNAQDVQVRSPLGDAGAACCMVAPDDDDDAPCCPTIGHTTYLKAMGVEKRESAAEPRRRR